MQFSPEKIATVLQIVLLILPSELAIAEFNEIRPLENANPSKI